MHRLALGALILLAACSSGPRTEDLLVACPTPGLLSDAVDMTRYRENSQPDLTNLILDARLVGIQNGTCRRARNDRAVIVQFGVSMQVDRGPAASGARSQTIPIVVGVTDRAGNLLSRETFAQAITFPVNSTRTRVTSEPIELILPVSETRRGNDYSILVGFLLTEVELAGNRRRGQR